MKRDNISIKFVSDNKMVNGMLHLPDREIYPCNAKTPLVVGSHGLEGSMESAKQQLFAQILPENGFAFLRFDHRGCGKSEGNFVEETSLFKRVEDMLCAVDYVLSLKLTSWQIFLFGSSLGGSTCIATWSKLVDKGLIPLGAILCAAPVNSLTIQKIPLNGNEHRPTLPMSFFEKNLLFDLTDKVKDLSNILIFHGDNDKTVPVENGYNLYDNAKEPKKLIILKGGDHQMSNIDDQKVFEVESLAWLKKDFI
ncbi:MAG: alpha/beta hydrolase [Desulfamplus sp.]|nr:alpha/beta hydrolase [Desulfamplus sp.]